MQYATSIFGLLESLAAFRVKAGAILANAGFVGIQISHPYDTFGEARGEKKARLFDVYGYTFLARKPG